MAHEVIHKFGASAYDNGDLYMRSKAKHDEWQRCLKCPLIRVNGNESLEDNFKIIQKARRAVRITNGEAKRIECLSKM